MLGDPPRAVTADLGAPSITALTSTNAISLTIRLVQTVGGCIAA